MSYDTKYYGSLLIVCIVLFFLAFKACTYRRDETIIVEQRWWTATTAVQYDETSTDCSYDVIEEGVKCTSDTDTYTRCSDSRTGADLPVTHPPTPCALRYGDYVSQGTYFTISYHVLDESETKRAQIGGHMWDSLAPGNAIHVRFNLLGNVAEVIPAIGR